MSDSKFIRSKHFSSKKCLFTVSSLVLACSVNSTAMAAHDFMSSAPIVVTATRFAASIDTAPVNVTTITAADIARSNATTLSDVLKAQAGVSVSNLFGISGSKAKVDMGGFGGNSGQNTLVLLNGRRLNDVDLQGANLASIPLDSIAQVEIVHGSGTVLYGDNAVSGVINIVTKNAFDGEHASVKLQAGSFQTQRLSTDLRKLSGDTAFSLAMDGIKSNGFRDNNAIENVSLAGEISQEKNAFHYGARINLSREKTGLPGALDEGTYKTNPSAANTQAKAKETRDSIEGFINGDHLATELTVSKKHQEYVSTSYEAKADLKTISLTPRLHRQYGRHGLVAGLDLYKSSLDTKAFPSEGRQDMTRDSYAAYISDTVTINKHTDFNFGLRKQQVKIDLNNVDPSSSTDISDDRSDSLTSWDITLNHQHNYGALNYVRLAKSFRFAVLDEMFIYPAPVYSPVINLLDPQTGRHIEIGTRQKFANGMQFNANLFRINLTDEIAYDGNANVNLDKTRHDGLNLSVSGAINKQLSFNAGYAYRKASFRSGTNDGKTVPQVPKQKLTLSSNYQLDNKRQIGLNAVHNGKRYFGNDFANTGKKMSSYTQVDANYTQQFSDWKARVLVQNLTNIRSADVSYYASWLTPPYTYYPLPERAIYITLEGEL